MFGIARRLFSAGLVTCLLPFIQNPPLMAQQSDSDIVVHFKQLTRSTEWRLAETIEMKFQTHHPQGMVIVDDQIFFSTVQIVLPTEKYGRVIDGYDRTPGKGIGHLFKVDRQGNLIAQVRLGSGSMYHPGGIDYDGKYIWVSVAEYRPNSESIIYRVDPSSMEAIEVFRFRDHIGDLVYNTADATLHGVSWGSRFFYTWQLNDNLEPIVTGRDQEELRKPNGNHYIDYQDCHYLRDRYMLCGGVGKYEIPIMGDYAIVEFAFGGLDLVDLRSHRAIHQVPVAQRVKPNLVMSFNPFFFELRDDHLRFYFMPEDDESTVYIYDAVNN